jgi:diguanylate cyclase (GGDEF)-like protein
MVIAWFIGLQCFYVSINLCKGIMNKNQEQKFTISTYHLLQHELVKFLYDRYMVGMVFTLIVAAVAMFLASYELQLQDRETWVYAWVAGLLAIQAGRYQLKKSYDKIKDVDYLSHSVWKKRFVIGVYIVGFWQGMGAYLVMPYISDNLQFIFHAFLLGLGAGAIAYLSTSMLVYGSYLLLMILPVTIYLFMEGTPDGIVLGCMYLFMIGAYYLGVHSMQSMIAETMHLRFDNQILVNDLQRLLNAVAHSNKELDQLSTTDELTGASNFRAFRVGLETQRLKHLDNKLPLSIAMLNIDYYYEYNLHYGYDMGNRTITSIAHLLMAELIKKDELVARVNGAEFGILLPGVSCEGAKMMMENVRSKLHEQKIQHEKSAISRLVTVSVGICCVPMNENISARDMIVRAEDALHQAKKKGRDRIEIIDS